MMPRNMTSPPFLQLVQNIIRHLLMLHLVGVPRLFNQNQLVAVAALYLLADHALFPVGHAGRHIVEVGGREQEEVLHLRIVMAGEVVDDLVCAEGMSCAMMCS